MSLFFPVAESWPVWRASAGGSCRRPEAAAWTPSSRSRWLARCAVRAAAGPVTRVALIRDRSGAGLARVAFPKPISDGGSGTASTEAATASSIAALHVIALARVRHHPPTAAYYQRLRDTGKTPASRLAAAHPDPAEVESPPRHPVAGRSTLPRYKRLRGAAARSVPSASSSEERRGPCGVKPSSARWCSSA
jgi:hypothetical protein